MYALGACGLHGESVCWRQARGGVGFFNVRAACCGDGSVGGVCFLFACFAASVGFLEEAFAEADCVGADLDEFIPMIDLPSVVLIPLPGFA